MDYNKPFTRTELNLVDYNNKFAFVDSVKELTKPHPRYIKRIWNDPTLFSYYFLRDNNNNPFKLYPYQDIILNDPHRYIYFRAANQVGKSVTFNVKAVHNLLRDHGHAHNEAIVSKSLPQTTYQMKRIKSLLNSMSGLDWKEDAGTRDSMSVLSYDIKNYDKPLGHKLKYSNMVVCAPCTEGLLGYDLHELDMDEFEYWPDVDLKWFFNQIAQPRTYTTKGNILVMTNPNGADNYGAELETQLLMDNATKKWHTYIFDYMDKPGNTTAEYDQLKHELSRQEFESTVAAIRSISSLAYLSPEEIAGSYDKNLTQLNMIGKQPFFFLDVGAKHDQSFLIGGYTEPHPDKELYERYGFNEVFLPIMHEYPVGYPLSRVAGATTGIDIHDGWHHEKSVREYLLEWSKEGILPVFGYDVTGNEGMRALFETIGIVAAQDILFSGPNKSGMYQRFKYLMEKGLVHRIHNKTWEKQAADLVATKGARGYLLINAASHVKKGGKSEDAKLKRIPDDSMDSSVGFIELADPMNIVEPSLTVY